MSLPSPTIFYYRGTSSTHKRSVFSHKKSFVDSNELYVGQAVSLVFEEGPKGAAAAKVKEEEGGGIAPVEEEGEREMGKVKVCK